MPPSLRNLLIVLGRWPRRLAAVACLLLAGTSALAARADASRPGAEASQPARPSAAGDRLGVPVHVRGGGYLRAGDRVDLISAPVTAAPAFGDTDPPGDGLRPAAGATVVAGDVRVVRVGPSADGDGSDLVVSVDRATALRLAALGSRELVAATLSSP